MQNLHRVYQALRLIPQRDLVTIIEYIGDIHQNNIIRFKYKDHTVS
jgi:hypothetical protein